MVNLTIDGINVTVPENTTILEAARTAGINIPTLCYLKDLNEIGACRVCMVEVEGYDKLFPACVNTVAEGMVIRTNSKKVRKVRKTNVELILSQHNFTCATCRRSGNCELQKISNDLNITNVPYPNKPSFPRGSKKLPLIKDYTKCINCMRCIQVCDRVQSIGVWDVINTGSRSNVDVKGVLKLKDSDCVFCGQCVTHCPVDALHERDDCERVFDAIEDPEKIVVVQVAPAVRAAWGEDLGLDREFATIKRLTAALRRLGFNYIFDTNFTADLTIMEEGSEFLERIKNPEQHQWPMFTSCCPGWVRFCKTQYPEMTDNLSTAKSPQQMFGAVAKSYYADILGVDPEKIFSVSIMPCVAKKAEADIPTMNDAGAGQDVDVVLTTREVARMVRSSTIVPENLPEEEMDMPLGVGTGAAVIFGATGGVMDAALRSAYYLVTGSNPDPDAFKAVRGMDGWKEAEFEIAGTVLKVAVVSGLGNTRKLLDAIKAGKVSYHFVEVMACPGGCAGGGGQPIHEAQELAETRGNVLWGLDAVANLRFSHENPSVLECYKNYFGAPLGEKSHHLLHTDHHGWDAHPAK